MDEVVIVEYNPQWAMLFEQEAARVREVLAENLVTQIEHIGSTAVPGLAAKPIIDLLVGVHSLAAAKQSAVSPLESLGYAYWADNPDPHRMFFVKGLPPKGPRTHHVHIVDLANPVWKERLLFRDYLRKHADAAAQYVELKRDLSRRFPTDREAYTRGKTEYVQSIMQKIRQSQRYG
ncbi:GrpB family protein [filamentous cyanobacterium CCP2]|nr:GrpB family protein [filamentous cyanobacterium CCP2]